VYDVALYVAWVVAIAVPVGVKREVAVSVVTGAK
jgi:hypothetical protein